MNHHQIDLHQGESIRLCGQTLTVLSIDTDTQEVVFEIEGPDGSAELIPAAFSCEDAEESVLV